MDRLGGRIAADGPPRSSPVRKATVSLDITGITGKRAASALSIGAASDTCNFFPVAPRQFFGTVSLGF